MVGNYKVVTLCGSTKFKDQFFEIQKELTLAGCIVISVGLFGHSGDNEVWTEGTKEMLDDMHKRKIDIADEIFVINVNGYIGSSTQSEIEYAKKMGKVIRFYNQRDVHIDDVGGFHKGNIGWNPNDVHCGLCERASCKGCEKANILPEVNNE